DLRVTSLAAEPVDERAVDLERIEGEPREIAKRRVPGPEVIEDELDPERLQLAQRLVEQLGVAEDNALGDLETQARRIQPADAKDVGNHLDESPLGQLNR